MPSIPGVLLWTDLVYTDAARMETVTGNYSPPYLVLNTTDTDTTSMPQPETIDPVVSVTGFCLGILINSVGIFGNVLVIAATRVSKAVRFNGLIASCAATDLAAILFCNVLQLATLKMRTWPFSRSLCIIQNIAFFQFMYTGMLHMVAIALCRALAAVSPRRFHMIQNRRVSCLILVAIHISIALCHVPKTFALHVYYHLNH